MTSFFHIIKYTHKNLSKLCFEFAKTIFGSKPTEVSGEVSGSGLCQVLVELCPMGFLQPCAQPKVRQLDVALQGESNFNMHCNVACEERECTIM